ncbi:MAG: hypothetical protein MZV49_14900 [Rhodopseudomonas palustris]|nr:hypothetical protein [Rhodopseudomonas palustris]
MSPSAKQFPGKALAGDDGAVAFDHHLPTVEAQLIEQVLHGRCPSAQVTVGLPLTGQIIHNDDCCTLASSAPHRHVDVISAVFAKQ